MRRIEAGRGEIHGRDIRMSRGQLCMCGCHVCVLKLPVIGSCILVPEWSPCVSWCETPDFTVMLLMLQVVVGNMDRIVWRKKKR